MPRPTTAAATGKGGWRTATGEIPYPIALKLRAGRGFDLVGVNTDGTAYAIDATSGVAMWTARYNPSVRRGDAAAAKALPFTPLAIAGPDGRHNVVVAFEGGLRALKGETGREIWRAPFAGRATAGTVADANGDGKLEILTLTSEPHTLVIVQGETGKVVSTSRLDARAVGSPALVGRGADSTVVIGYEDGTVEARHLSGERANAVKLDSPVTTSPLVLPTSRDLIVVIGAEKGLFAMSAAELRLLGKIDTGGDTPVGRLISADVDGDGSVEVVMVTRAGRVALIGTTDGRIRWVAEGASGAGSAVLADLNGDGVLDVITAAGPSFARGFSGKDGSLIWSVEEEAAGSAPSAPANPSPRRLVVAPSSADGAFLVGADPSRVGLRAVELPKGAVRTAVN